MKEQDKQVELNVPSVTKEIHLLRVQTAQQNKLLAESLQESRKQRLFWHSVSKNVKNVGNLMALLAVLWFGRVMYEELPEEAKTSLSERAFEVVVLPLAGAGVGYFLKKNGSLGPNQPEPSGYSLNQFNGPSNISPASNTDFSRSTGLRLSVYDTPPDSDLRLDESRRRKALEMLDTSSQYEYGYQDYVAPDIDYE